MADIKRIANEVYMFMRGGHANVQSFLCEKAVRECVANKADLIKLLSKHPNWDEDNLRIHFDMNYTRAKDAAAAEVYLQMIGSRITESVGENADACDYNKCISLPEIGGEFYERGNPLRNLGEMLYYMYNIRKLFVEPNVSEVTEHVVKQILPDARIHAGQKTTRALFGLLKQYGWQEALTGHNTGAEVNPRTGEIVETDSFTRARQHYNDYTDAMNPLTITRHTVLSVNPMDFLRMSYGNSWSSCHYIDDGRAYDGDGGWSAGCWSYAYDWQTMIFYTVDGSVDNDELTYAKKYTRQCFHWNGEALMPARLYPQKFNCSPDAPPYVETRTIVEKIFSDCMGIGNMWRKLSIRSFDASITSFGHHYRDYTEMINAFIFVPSFAEYGKTDAELAEFEIGSDDAICVCCGDYLDDSDYPICSSCAGGGRYCEHCGRYDDDGEYVNGEWICRSCLENDFVWDDLNDRYIRDDESIYVYGLLGRGRNGYTDEDECGYGGIFYCEDCGRYFNSDYYKEYFTADGITICDDCFSNYYDECSRCGEIHNKNCMVKNSDGEYVCDGCVEEDEFICECCGTLHKSDEVAEEIGVKKYCAECYENKRHVCEDCGKVYYGDEDTDMLGEIGTRVCRECLRNYDKCIDGRFVKAENVGYASSEYIYGVRRWNGEAIELIARNQIPSASLFKVYVPVELIDEIYPMFSDGLRGSLKTDSYTKLMKDGKRYIYFYANDRYMAEDGSDDINAMSHYIAWFLTNSEEKAA